MKKNNLIIFIHIPKAAGTTINKIIERQYAPNNIFTLNGKNIFQSIENLKSHKDKINLKMLRGHMPFGLHKMFSQQTSYITLLRNPIERVVSHYYYVINTKQHYLHKYIKNYKINLKDYVTEGMSTEIDNGQTRVMAGLLSGVTKYNDIAHGKCSNAMLKKAMCNLNNKLTIIGLAERFDETLLLIQKIYGWKTPYYIVQNKNRRRPKITNISADTLAKITDLNHYDIELYNFAREKFNNTIKQTFSSSNGDLEQFKLHNFRSGRKYYYLTYYKSTIHKFYRILRGY